MAEPTLKSFAGELDSSVDGPWSNYSQSSQKSDGPWGQYAGLKPFDGSLDAEPAPGFVARLGQGASRALDSAKTALTDDPNKIAKIAADQARTALPQTPLQRQLADEFKPYVDAANKAEGFVDNVTAWGAAGLIGLVEHGFGAHKALQAHAVQGFQHVVHASDADAGRALAPGDFASDEVGGFETVLAQAGAVGFGPGLDAALQGQHALGQLLQPGLVAFGDISNSVVHLGALTLKIALQVTQGFDVSGAVGFALRHADDGSTGFDFGSHGVESFYGLLG